MKKKIVVFVSSIKKYSHGQDTKAENVILKRMVVIEGEHSIPSIDALIETCLNKSA